MASMRKKKGNYYARFYDKRRTPKRKEVPLRTTRKDVARRRLAGQAGSDLAPLQGHGSRRQFALPQSAAHVRLVACDEGRSLCASSKEFLGTVH